MTHERHGWDEEAADDELSWLDKGQPGPMLPVAAGGMLCSPNGLIR
jgi:hypothetical protein